MNDDVQERIKAASLEISDTLDRYNLMMLVDVFSGAYFLIPEEDQQGPDDRQLH